MAVSLNVLLYFSFILKVITHTRGNTRVDLRNSWVDSTISVILLVSMSWRTLGQLINCF